MNSIRLTINGQSCSADARETILDVARRVGVDVPTLCHADGLPIEGGCRMCLVQVAGEERPRAACHSSVRDGMVIDTDTPRLQSLRRAVLELMVLDRPPGTLVAGDSGRELERLMAKLGVTDSRPRAHEHVSQIDASHSYLRFNGDLCITCRRCLHACDSVQGQFVWGVADRGAPTHMIYGPADRLDGSGCVSCGACVDACPSGAISDVDRLPQPRHMTHTSSVCGYCGVGCRVEVATADGRVASITGVPGAAVNHGHLCVKGRYAHTYQHHPERLNTPLLRDGGALKPVTWENAIAWLAERLRDIAGRRGPDSVGFIASSRSTNEACYLLQKLARTAVGTNNIDCCARVCHSSTALAMETVTGAGAATASFDDIEHARCIVVCGANPTEAHPVVGARIKQAALRGVPLIVIDPRRIELAEFAAVHLRPRPGANVPLFNALARVLIDDGTIDRACIAQRLEGFEDLREHLTTCDIKQAESLCGVAADAMIQAARLIGRAGPTLFVHGLGLSEQTQGTESIMAWCNIAMLTGSIGVRGAGVLPLRGQNNVQGAADMGCMPGAVTGYQSLRSANVRTAVEAVWGAQLPITAGKTTPEMMEAAARGELAALWVQGEDIAQSEVDQTHIVEAMGRLELLVVQDPFMCETARYAHLVLPAATVMEQDGTFTNGERRIQRVRPATSRFAEARPDWEVVRDVGAAMGMAWSYPTPGDVMHEIARTAPRLFGGVSYDRLNADGLQWPCPGAAHPGTSTLHVNGFMRGKGRLTVARFKPGPEVASDEFPFILITGRVLEHYNVGTMTRRTDNQRLAPVDVLEIHPSDATRLGLKPGEPASLRSHWGSTRAAWRDSQRVTPGTLFLSFHDPATRTNCLVGPHFDPLSHCPDYKSVAVSVAPDGAG